MRNEGWLVHLEVVKVAREIKAFPRCVSHCPVSVDPACQCFHSNSQSICVVISTHLTEAAGMTPVGFARTTLALSKKKSGIQSTFEDVCERNLAPLTSNLGDISGAIAAGGDGDMVPCKRKSLHL